MRSTISLRCILHLIVYSTITSVIDSLSNSNFDQLSSPERTDAITKCDDRRIPRKKIVCYYRVEDEFRPYDADPCLCTHIIYSFVAIRDNFAFIAGKKGDLRFLSALKQQNPGLKILVSLRPSNNQFLQREAERTNSTASEVRSRFGKRVREFVRRHELDGVDLDWEYFKEAHDHFAKRETLISLLNILSNELKPFNETSDENHNLLTITTSKFARDLTDYYDFSEIYRAVDFVNVPAFDFDSNPTTVKHPSRLHGVTDMENMDSIIDLVLALGLPQDQLVVGVPAFGTLLKLWNVSQTEPGSPASAWGTEELIISHSKICAIRDSANWTLVRDKDLTAPYIYNREKWIGFDDEISIKLKAKYIALRQLSGLALWNLNDDDYSGKCGYGPFPILQSIRSVFLQSVDNINYNNSIETIHQTIDNSFVAVIEKYGNVERITDSGSEDSSLLCPHSGYMRHPNDCTKFYRCVQYNKNDENPEIFQYSCPIGLVFDERYELCNWPSWSPSCHGSGEIVSLSKKRFMCPSYGYFQDPENCEFFYYCSDFGKVYLQPYQMKCPFDLAFDEEKLLCNWKWLVKGCGPVDPADQVIKDLPQLLNQNAGIEPLAEETSDRFMERSDYIDVDSVSANNDNSNSKPVPDKTQGSRFKKITQYMTRIVGNLGSRIKDLFSNTKIESRSGVPSLSGNRWLSRVNNYMPKFNKKRPNTDNNRHLMPFMSDPLVSIPMLEIRPETHQLRNIQNKGKQQSQRKSPMGSSPAPKRNRYPVNHLSFVGLNGLNGFHDDLLQMSSISKTVQKIQEMIPLRAPKNRVKGDPKEPTPMASNAKVTNLIHSSTTSATKSTRRPQKGSTKNRFRPKFQLSFPTTEPLMIETMEEIELPHYMPQQLSFQSIPMPKKSNVRHQQQSYLGGIDSHREVLHFSPEELNLDKIKVERKVTPKPNSKTEEPRDEKRDKSAKPGLKHKNVNPMEINFHNIDSKLLESFQYSLPESDKNDFQTIHLANNPNKEIKINLNIDSKPSVHQKHTSDEEFAFNRYNQKPIAQKTNQNREKVMSHQNQKPKERLPINTIHLGHSIQHLNQYLPDTENILKQQMFKLPAQQPNQMPTQNWPNNQQIHQQNNQQNNQQIHQQNNKQNNKQNNQQNNQKPIAHNHQSINTEAQNGATMWSHGARPQENLPNFVNFESQKMVENDGSAQGMPSPLPPYSRDPLPLPSKQTLDTNFGFNRYSDGSAHKPVEQLDVSATINQHFPSYQLPNQRPTYDKFRPNTINLSQDLRNKNRVKTSTTLSGQKEPEKTQLLIVPVSDHISNVHKYTNFENVNKEYPNLFSEDVILDHKKEIKSELKTTARPRVIFSAPSSVSPSAIPSMDDEYIMLMMNNEQNNTDRQKSIHEIFKKTDGKLYNLETDSSKTLVALVPKTPTTPKPVLYESIPNMVSFNVTQPPVVIKFEIPRPKSHVFQNIVQKVRNEWLAAPYGQSSYQTPTQYHVIKHEYPKQYNEGHDSSDSVSPQPFIPMTHTISYHTLTTPSPIQEVPQSHDPLNLPSIYDSLQQILHNQWSQSQTTSTEAFVPSETTTPIPTTTTSATSTTQHSSVILEHIPLYNQQNNHTNGMAWPQNALPWYQQVVPPYPVHVDPYQPYPPPLPPMSPNYPYYQLQSGYGYRSPPNIQQSMHSFHPQFLSPNLTSNNWYDFYENEQRVSPSEDPITTITTSTTTTTTTTTTPPTTQTIVVTLPSTQRPVPKVRNRPSFANRRTTKKPKTTTQEIKVEVSTENSYDIRRENPNKEKPKIEVIIVDDHNQRQEHTPRHPESEPEVKVVYVDSPKEEPKQKQNSNTNSHDEETYGLRNGVKPIFKDHSHYQTHQNEHHIQQELPKFESTSTLEPIVPKVEHQINKDVEYEDEPEVGSNIREEMKNIVQNAKVETPETVNNPNPYATANGVRNASDSVPESACTRPGLFQHPFDCNKYYECFWDKYINKFTLHSFECAVKLAFDSRIVGCGLPSDPTICVQY